MKTAKTELSKRIISAILSAIMLFTLIPTAFTAFGAEDSSFVRKADVSTMDTWKQYLGPDVLDTTNAGVVWGDKSVFTNADAFPNVTMLNEQNNFLVALSAMGSNKTITGYSALPTDTVIVLDLSNSMSNTSINNMVTATNDALRKLFELNPNNRVGVILYAGTRNNNNNAYTVGNSASVLLDIDRYSGVVSRFDNTENFIEYNDGRVRVISGVKNSNGSNASGGKNVGGATYIQSGLWLAWKQFEAIEDTSVTSGVQDGTTRMPVMVLMSDGAATAATTSYTDVGNSTHGTGGSSSATAENAFLIQLTCSWVREKMSEHYKTAPLFYTLGLGVGDNNVARTVLDPSYVDINDSWWTTYLSATDGANVNYAQGYTVKRNVIVKTQHYVDKYFGASNAQNLISAFGQIVDQIIIQSRYYPTKAPSGNYNLDGYITFNDDLGDFMEVKDIKGLTADGNFYSGAAIAQAISSNTFGDIAHGDLSSLTPEGWQILKAVEKRLGCTEAQAEAAVSGALKAGQLSFDSSTGEFSNYIGWFAYADGSYAGFWDGTMNNVPAGAVYINRSYGFLGTVGEGHSETDMLFVSVQVHQHIATGHQTVIWKIPASLVPLSTYEIDFEGDTVEEGTDFTMKVTGATEPIRLIFEVGLRSDITSYNITEKVGADYAHINPDGTYSFYSNAWGSDAHADPEMHNATTMTFEPSTDNELYYYSADTYIYGKNPDGTYSPVLTDPRNSSEKFYFVKNIFTSTGVDDEAAMQTVYVEIDSAIINDNAKQDSTNTPWYIPKGINKHVVTGSGTPKADNSITDTISYVILPVVTDATATEKYHFDGYLGNNGKLTVYPDSGIKLSKSLDVAVPNTNTDFVFDIALTAPEGKTLKNSYILVRYDAQTDSWTESSIAVTNGTVSVAVSADESVYIVGLSAGTEYTVTERNHDDYKVKSVNGINGAEAYAGTVREYTVTPVSFINTLKVSGHLIISKNVLHPFNDGRKVSNDILFTAKIDLGADNAGKSFETSRNVTVTADGEGVITVALADGESVALYDIPDGTEYTVYESNMPDGFSLSEASSSGLAGTISADENRTANIVNIYSPTTVSPVNITVDGVKLLTGREWLDTDEFIFELQKFDGVRWVAVGQRTSVKKATSELDEKAFDLSDALQGEIFNAEGTYKYRVVEITTNPIGGIKYDSAARGFDITVEDGGWNGRYVISSVESSVLNAVTFENNEYNVSFDFNNSYAASGNDEITIDITKYLENETGVEVSLEGFEFGLYENGKLFATSDATDINGKASITVVYDATMVGNSYTYILKEIVPENPVPGMLYSTKTYELKVDVIDLLDGNIDVQLVYDELTYDNFSADFTNTYELEGAKEQFTVTKELEGKDLTNGEFTFYLYESNEDWILGKLADTATNDATGLISFKQVEFTRAGTYYYVIKEDTSVREGISYDYNEYRIAVTVAKGDNGSLASSVEIKDINNQETAEDEMVFVNTYTPGSTSVELKVTKHIDNFTNGNIGLSGFNFLLEGEGISDIEITDAAGVAVFTLNYSAADIGNEYTYYISELNTGMNGMYYSQVVYTVTATVGSDSGSGNITVDFKVDSAHVNSVDLEFTNVYSFAMEQFTAEKLLEGKDLEGDDFTFILYEANHDWIIQREIERVKNMADGSITFSELAFGKEGIYNFIIVEDTSVAIEGMKYDGTEYRISVNVTVDSSGKYNSEATLYDREMNIIDGEMIFTNIFTPADITVNLDVIKTVDNHTDKHIGLEGFNFKLDGEEHEALAVTDTNGRAGFELTFTAEDIGESFTYVITEVNTGIDGMVYSEKAYTVNVTVVSNNGELEASLKLDGIDVETVVTEFVNVYSFAELSVEAEKTLEGRTLAPDEFSFELYAANEAGDTLKLLETAKNKADGSVTFTAIEFGAEGQYFFILKENTDNYLEGITYDYTEYFIIVNVAANSEGVLKANAEITEGGETAAKALFENTYTAPEDINVTYNVQKILVNNTDEVMGLDGFKFKVEGDASAIITSDVNGKASFDITYTAADVGKTFTYIITEVNTEIGGMTYSTAVHTVTAEIIKNNNVLSARLTLNSETVDSITAEFTNIYNGIPNIPDMGIENSGIRYIVMMICAGFVFAAFGFGKKRRAN